MDEGAASRNANDVLMLRVQIKSLRELTVIVNKTTLETEKARDEIHNQIQQIEQRLYPKRTHSHDDAHEMLAEVDNWDLRDHRQQATRVKGFRQVGMSTCSRVWSPQEEKQVCPGHFWMLKVDKVSGSNSCVEKKFMLGIHKYEEYKGVHFGNGDCVLLVDVCLHRVDEDDSGLTFEEWDPSTRQSCASLVSTSEK